MSCYTGSMEDLPEEERKALEEYHVMATARLMTGCCPVCNTKLTRGKTLPEKIKNRVKLIRYCPNCGHTVAEI